MRGQVAPMLEPLVADITGVEDARYTNVHFLLLGIGVAERLRHPLALVVARPRPNRVHVAPVRFRLWVHVRIAVHLGRAGDQHLRPDALCQSEHVDRTERVGFDRLDRVVHVVRRAGRAGQVVDFVHLDEQRVHDVVVDQLEVFVPQPVLDVTFPPGKEVVHHDHFVTLHHQIVDQVRTDESGTTRYLRGNKEEANGLKRKHPLEDLPADHTVMIRRPTLNNVIDGLEPFVDTGSIDRQQYKLFTGLSGASVRFTFSSNSHDVVITFASEIVSVRWHSIGWAAP
uniref:Uncharacterized protein n=1 Tax=Anopheles atroparvus TaxID=41427 RepID=A0A182ILJ5_ANOAO